MGPSQSQACTTVNVPMGPRFCQVCLQLTCKCKDAENHNRFKQVGPVIQSYTSGQMANSFNYSGDVSGGASGSVGLGRASASIGASVDQRGNTSRGWSMGLSKGRMGMGAEGSF